MRLTRRKFWIPPTGISPIDRDVLDDEGKLWRARIAALSSSPQAYLEKNPEELASARFLNKLDYFLDARAVLNFPDHQEAAAKRINEAQQSLAELRKKRKDCKSEEKLTLRALAKSLLMTCSSQRITIEALYGLHRGCYEDLLNSAAVCDKYLTRIGMSEGSLLRPDALVPVQPPNGAPIVSSPVQLSTAPVAPQVSTVVASSQTTTKVFPSGQSAHGSGTQIHPHHRWAKSVLHTMRDFQRLLDAGSDLKRFSVSNPASPLSRAFRLKPETAKAICRQANNTQNLNLAYEIVGICENRSVRTIRKA